MKQKVEMAYLGSGLTPETRREFRKLLNRTVAARTLLHNGDRVPMGVIVAEALNYYLTELNRKLRQAGGLEV